MFRKKSFRVLRLKIRTKIIAIIFIALLIIVGANNIITSTVFTREYSSALKNEALVIGEGLKNQLERLINLGISLEDIMGFENQCLELVEKNPSFSYAAVLDPSGNILFHSDPQLHGTNINESPIITALNGQGQSIIEYGPGYNRNFAVILPISDLNNNFSGAIILGFPKQIITQKIATLTGYSITISLILFIIALLLIVTFLLMGVTKPLHKLIDYMDQVGQGNFTINIGKVSNDEIGDAIDNFQDDGQYPLASGQSQ